MRPARAGVAISVLLGLAVTVLALGHRWQLEAQSREALVVEGRRLLADKGCTTCHTIGAAGTPIAPDLRRAALRYSEATLAKWLLNPSAQEPTKHMPDLQLTEAEAQALAAYLHSLP